MNEFKVGDKVFNKNLGINGIVTSINSHEKYCLRVEFESGYTGNYTRDGKFFSSHQEVALSKVIEQSESSSQFGEPKVATKGGGLRYNTGKAELHQVPTSLINGVANVLQYGAQKYSAGNWRKGMDWTVPYDCLQRHMMRWLDGEEKDAESGLPHLYHAAANIAMLIEYSETCKELDNRFKGDVNPYDKSFSEHTFNEIKKDD